MQENWLQSLGQEDPLEWEMAAHPNILAWRIPRTEEPGGLHRVTNSQTRLSTAHIRTYIQARIIDQREIWVFFLPPTPCTLKKWMRQDIDSEVCVQAHGGLDDIEINQTGFAPHERSSNLLTELQLYHHIFPFITLCAAPHCLEAIRKSYPSCWISLITILFYPSPALVVGIGRRWERRVLMFGNN